MTHPKNSDYNNTPNFSIPKQQNQLKPIKTSIPQHNFISIKTQFKNINWGSEQFLTRASKPKIGRASMDF